MVLASYLKAIQSLLGRNDEGQGLIEYGLIIMLVSIVSIAALGLLETTINGLYTVITAAV